MTYLFIFIPIIIIWGLFYSIQRKKQDEYKNKLKEEERKKQYDDIKANLEKMLPALSTAVKDFKENCLFESYFNGSKYTAWRKDYEELNRDVDIQYKRILLNFKECCVSPEVKRKLHTFSCYYNDKIAKRIIDKYNSKFIKKELENKKNRILFNKIEEYKLSEEQRTAIVTDEDNNLVVAGAGTGKTTTIVGKVAYLISRLGVSPDDILILAFNKKVVKELSDRLRERSNQFFDQELNFKVHTFHSYGCKVIAEVKNGFNPDIEYDTKEKLQNCIYKIFKNLIKQEYYAEKVIKYLSFYLKPYKPQTAKEFKSLGDYFEYLKSYHIMTLKRETLKSFEEVEIANFLFLNNIEYRYEEKYKYDVGNRGYRQYKPDFYLPEYDIYIEHWGIDRDGKVPNWFESKDGLNPSQLYQKGMEWKRQIHEDHKTTLVETYSYQKREGNLIAILTENLKNLKEKKVVFKKKSNEDILEYFEATKKECGGMPLIIKLLIAFLNLFKSNLHNVMEIRQKIDNLEMIDKERSHAFMDVFEPIYNEYQEDLVRKKAIDFSDMIKDATQSIENGKFLSHFKYIIIDEFQDMSSGKCRFIKSLIHPTETKVFCVGDDWQSIYRFAGNDLSIMTSEFEECFGFAGKHSTKKLLLKETFRFNDKILGISSEFIQKNPNQIRKNLKTKITTDGLGCEIHYKEDNANSEISLIENILLDIDSRPRNKEKADVLVLGRYTFNEPQNLNTLRGQFKNLEVKPFLTIHKAKGLEADYVIIIDVVTGKLGFPSEIEDDPILGLLLAKPDSYENSEERRLFYVALTRARHKVYILSQRVKKSVFVEEIDKENQVIEKCPLCITGDLIMKTGRRGDFLGCSNYSYCTYTSNDIIRYGTAETS